MHETQPWRNYQTPLGNSTDSQCGGYANRFPDPSMVTILPTSRHGARKIFPMGVTWETSVMPLSTSDLTGAVMANSTVVTSPGETVDERIRIPGEMVVRQPGDLNKTRPMVLRPGLATGLPLSLTLWRANRD